MGTTLGPVWARKREATPLSLQCAEIESELPEDLCSHCPKFHLTTHLCRFPDGLAREQGIKEGNTVATGKVVVAGPRGNELWRFPEFGWNHPGHHCE